MNDFKKGLLIGALTIIGCVTFMAHTNAEREELLKDVDTLKGLFIGRYVISSERQILDTSTGNLYEMGLNDYIDRFNNLQSINDGEDVELLPPTKWIPLVKGFEHRKKDK